MPLRENRLYEYVPAAIDSLTKGLTIGVRFTSTKSKNILHQHYRVTKVKNAVKVELFDREVYFMRASDDPKNRINAADFDTLLDLDFFSNKSLLSQAGYTFAMVNSHAVPKKYHIDYDYEKKEDWPEVIADSGGFQLRTGVADFLSPKEIVEAQGRICSIGISLDVPFPLTHGSEVSLFRRAAFVQKWNNEVFKAHKTKNMKLMNVIHGPNFYLLDKYREVVEDEDIDRVAIGGVRKLELTPLVFRLMNVILKGKKYKQYHALGVSGLERWVLLCYLAHKKIAKLITSDSSSYIQCGINMQAFDNTRLCYSQDMRSATPDISQYRRLACSCPVCSTLEYAVLANDRANSMSFSALVAHNLFVGKSYLDEIYQLTSHSHKEILAYLSQHVTKQKLLTIQKAMHAVDMSLQDGLEKAARRYSPYLLSKDPTTHTNRNTIFQGVSVTTEATKKMRERVDFVLSQFEKFHGKSS